jgi:F-type H+-transporting ATPase subunit b
MDINITLFGEMLTFAALVWVMMKYIWPPLMKAIEERQQKIADGLAAAERGKNELALAQTNITEQLRQTKAEAVLMLNQASVQAGDYLEKKKAEADEERIKLLAQAKIDIEQEMNSAKYILQQQTADLVITAAEKILLQKVDSVTQKKLVNELISSI